MTSLDRIRARALVTAYGLLYGPLAWAYDAVAWLSPGGQLVVMEEVVVDGSVVELLTARKERP